MQDDSHRPGRPGLFATGSPRPVESRKRDEAGLLACTVPVACHGSSLAGWRLPARWRSGCVDPLSALTVAGAAAACTAFPS